MTVAPKQREMPQMHTGAGPTARRLPNCLIIGAAKAGTTSLFRYMQQHPDIYMHPRKQLNFFAASDPKFNGPAPRDLSLRDTTTLPDYCAQFAAACGQKIVGEASNSYLYSPQAASRIRATVPGVKLIAILRHPVERAYSRFLQLVRSGRETASDFEEALALEEQRVRDNWWPDFHYLRMGLYCEQLQRYFDLFPRESIRVFLFDELKRDPAGLAKRAFEFLEVDSSFTPDTTIVYSNSGLPQNRPLHVVLQSLRKARPLAEVVMPLALRKRVVRLAAELHNKNLGKPQLPPTVMRRFTAHYRDDILRLQDLIGQDLSAWLERR